MLLVSSMDQVGVIFFLCFFSIFALFLFAMLFKENRSKVRGTVKKVFGAKAQPEVPATIQIPAIGQEEEKKEPPVAPPRQISVRIPTNIRRESGDPLPLPPRRSVQLEIVTEKNEEMKEVKLDGEAGTTEDLKKGKPNTVTNDYIYV